jgi:hypothetical protein
VYGNIGANPKTDSRMIVPIVGNSKLFKAREQNKTGREKSWKGEFQAQKKPPSGGHDITTYCFDYSGIYFPGTRGGT